MVDADVFQIKIEGIEELDSKLAAIDRSLDSLIQEATAEAAAVVAREAQINSGRGGAFPNRITGNLMRSIKIIRTKKTGGKCEVEVGSAMKYALRLEYGFNEADKKGRRYHQAPRPYLRPALDENKDKVTETYRAKIQAILGGP